MAARVRRRSASGGGPLRPETYAPRPEAGKWERLWYARQTRDLAHGAERGLTWRSEAGERVVQFIEGYCVHHKGKWAGKPLILSSWQRELIRQVFGWFRADGTRRYRTAYIEIPRKNGKSTKAAGVGLYLTVADNEPGAEVYSSATKRDQARIVWDEAAKTADKSERLQQFLVVTRAAISCDRLGSKFVPLSAESQTMDGLNPHGNIVDELHAHRDRGVWDKLDTAMGAREQPLTFAITTAGTYDPTSIGWEMHEYACNVLEGVFEDDSFFAFITSAEIDGDMEELLKDRPDYFYTEEAQRRANPNYGVSVKPDFLAKQAEKAQRQPSFDNEYRRYHLDLWTQQVTRWIRLEKWAACEPAPPGAADARRLALAREEALRGRDCHGGLDLSSKLDLAAFVLTFIDPADLKAMDVICRFWLPQATYDEALRKKQVHLKVWADAGWLTITPGNVIDYEAIRTEVEALSKIYPIQTIGYDPWGATDLSNRLLAAGQKMVEVRQGYQTMSEPSKDFEARVVDGKVRHMWNPVLRWCVSNAVVRTDPAGNIKPDKERAKGKIDGLVATIISMSRGIASPPPSPSVYTKDRGLVSL